MRDTRLILGDPGAVSGGGKKSKRVRKNSGEKKSRRRRRAPGDKVLTDQFQTAGVILASDWCQKPLYFSALSQSSKTRSHFASSYTIATMQASCSPCLLEEKGSNHSTKCRGDRSTYPLETRRKYSGPFAGIVTFTYFKTD